MKKILVAFTMMLAVAFTTTSAKAQTSSEAVNTVVAGLIGLNVNVQDVAIVVEDVITIGDITITDVIDVSNVLNKNEIKILNDFIVTIDVDNVLNNILQNADILNNNVIVVGLLSNLDGTFTLVTETVKSVKDGKVKV